MNHRLPRTLGKIPLFRVRNWLLNQKQRNTMTAIKMIFIALFTGCLTVSFGQSYVSRTIQYDGETRAYKIYVPAVYDGSSAIPLIFNFHGGSGTIANQIAIGDMSDIADTANFIAVYPQALADPNDGGSTNWMHKTPTSVDDVFFIDALIDSVSSDYMIDANRIYACGYSLGGEFTFELGCRLNSRIAAIGVVARTMQKRTYDNCAPGHPTGVMTILGTADAISDYNGVWWGGVQYYMSADESHDYWVTSNNCDTNAVTVNLANTSTSDGSTVERNTWSTSLGCAYVEELKVINGGHDWPGSFGNMDIDATQEIWNFVSRYDLNGLIECSTNSIHENSSPSKDYKVYPVPFENDLNIEAEHAGNTQYIIYNSIGVMVLNGFLVSAINTIDLSSLPPNVYVLHIDNQSLKLIKTE